MALELVLLGVVVLLVLVAGWLLMTFNRLVTLRNRIENAGAQIDVQLKRRYDLIPNLVESVKGYMKHERDTLTTIAKMRSSLVTGSMEDKEKANNQITQALKTIFAVSENYPELKANENFKMLQEELAGTEDKISYIRTAFNDALLEYNNSIQVFPASLLANMFGFQKKDYLQATPVEQEAVKVKFQ